MKNLFICILGITFIAGGCNKAENKKLNDLEAANLKGNVIQVTESYHKVGSSCCPGGDKNDCSKKTTLYNKDGYTLETLKIGVQGDTIQRSCYRYNDVPECTAVDNYKGRYLISHETNETENGLVKKVAVTDDKNLVTNTHLFDYQKGLLVNSKTFDGDGNLLNSFICEYQGTKVKTETVYNSHGEVFSISSHKRNSHGDIVESTVIHPRDKSEFTVNYEYTYDDNGNWIKQTKIYNDDIISIRIREIKYL